MILHVVMIRSVMPRSAAMFKIMLAFFSLSNGMRSSRSSRRYRPEKKSTYFIKLLSESWEKAAAKNLVSDSDPGTELRAATEICAT